MKKTLIPFFLLFGLLIAARFQAPGVVNERVVGPTLTRIAFGSCNRQDEKQPLWPFIVQNQPQLWIWLGDNIYGDTQDMTVMKQKYELAKNDPGYRQLLATCPVIGIWDDHDFGVNDVGKEYAKKDESQQLMLEFLDEPADSPRWKREGTYGSYEYGEKGKQVKVILLDSRYFRDELKKQQQPDGTMVNEPNPNGDILGEAQWKWLEQQLTNSPARIHLIGCGIQILPEEHVFEKWANFPKARQRLLNLIQKTQARGIILLSGDRHVAEISKMPLPGYPNPLYEVTSSGLTHTWSKPRDEPNRFRVDSLVAKLNFGVLLIDWNAQPLTVNLQVRGENNQLYLDRKVSFQEK